MKNCLRSLPTNKYVCPRNSRTEMYTGRVTCCPVCPIKFRKKTGRTDGQTDERQTETLRFPLNVVSVKIDTLHVTELNESLRSPQARLEPGGEEEFIPHHAPLTYHASHLLHFKVRFFNFREDSVPGHL